MVNIEVFIDEANYYQKKLYILKDVGSLLLFLLINAYPKPSLFLIIVAIRGIHLLQKDFKRHTQCQMDSMTIGHHTKYDIYVECSPKYLYFLKFIY